MIIEAFQSSLCRDRVVVRITDRHGTGTDANELSAYLDPEEAQRLADEIYISAAATRGRLAEKNQPTLFAAGELMGSD